MHVAEWLVLEIRNIVESDDVIYTFQTDDL